MPNFSPAARRLLLILEQEARGRRRAIPASHLADRLGVSERQLRGLVSDLIDAGSLVGSCQRRRGAGYFLMVNRADLEEGTETLRRHALSVLYRISRVKRAAEAAFGPSTLFDLRDLDVDDLDQEAS